MIKQKMNLEADLAANQMIVSAAHQIKDGDVIYVGLGLPMLAVLLAKYTHAPATTVIIENGIVRTSLFDLPASTDTLGSQTYADQLNSLFYINCMGQAGHINLGFLGAGEIDMYGNINDTVVGDYKDPFYRYPGGGGANDVISFCPKTCIVVRQKKNRFRRKVDFVTCPGYLDGLPGQREKAGLPPDTGPSTVITDLGIYGFENGEMILKSVHACVGMTVERVKAEVEWDLKVAADLQETVPPTEEELEILRTKVDPAQIWVGGKRDFSKRFS
ncbi:MAG TPA: CoA-transferase [Dehalococcoidales bacterium]|nr:CoA-transferase [Dehalococcoidales bacterium]